MPVLTIPLMNNAIQEMYTKDGFYYDPYFPLFYLLRNYGLRYNEAAKLNLWTFSANNTITIPLSKGQTTRTLSVNTAMYNFIKSFYDRPDQLNFVNNSTASNIFSHYCPINPHLISGKFLRCHFLRHAYIKNLWQMGQTPQQIATTICETNVANVAGYINSVIYY